MEYAIYICIYQIFSFICRTFNTISYLPHVIPHIPNIDFFEKSAFESGLLFINSNSIFYGLVTPMGYSLLALPYWLFSNSP